MRRILVLIIAVLYFNIGYAQLSVYFNYNLCAAGCSGYAYAYSNGGTPPYTYLWSNGETGSHVDSLCPGLTSVTVTDNIGNTATNSFNLLNYPPMVATTVSQNTWCTYANGSIDATITGGVPPYTGVWGGAIFSSTLHPTNLPAGNYWATISDANGCSTLANGTVGVTDLPVNIGVDHSVCNGMSETLTVPTIANPPITYQWNDNSANSSLAIQPTGSGIYSVTVTDYNGCSGTDSISINVISNCNVITGKVFYDSNQNGIKDVTENGMANVIVEAAPGQNYAASDTSGFYRIYTDVGNYSINLVSSPSNNIITTPAQTAIFTGSGGIDSLNYFGLIADVDTSLSANLTMGCARPGFEHIESFNVINFSNAPLVITAKLIYDSNLILQSVFPPYDHINGDTIVWVINNFYQYSSLYFYNWLAYDYPYSFSQGYFSATFMVPPTAILGDTLFSSVIVEPINGDIYPSNNISSDFKIITGSFDPNNVEVFPGGAVTKSQVDNEQWMEYTINFQNTGNDTCFTVQVIDTIPQLLDLSSIQVLSSSHPFLMNIYECELSWTFPNILLPDSSESMINSSGFIKYKIKILNYANVGDIIENSANIFFDYNLPVVTNTAQTPIIMITNIEEQKLEELSFYPNPVKSKIYIDLTKFKSGDVNIEIINGIGQVVKKNKLQSGIVSLVDMSILAKGIYIIKLSNNEICKSKKIIKE